MESFLVTVVILLAKLTSLSHCISNSYESSSDLDYHGGKIMTEPIAVSLLWFGSGWREHNREAIRNAIASLTSSRYGLVEDSDVPTLGNWWEITAQYKNGYDVGVTNRVDLGAECFYSGQELNVTRDQVVDIATSAFKEALSCTRAFEVSEFGVYHVLFSDTVMFLESKGQWEFVEMCRGMFEMEVSKGVRVNMRWAKSPMDDQDQCSIFFRGDSYLGPPNGDEKVDSLVGYVLASVAEEATNGDGLGWFSSDGNESTISSSCDPMIWRDKESGPPLFRDTNKNLSFNVVGLNGYRYMVYYLWDQKIKNCALKPSENCGAEAIIFKQPNGYIRGGITINHTDGLQPYPPNQICRWEIDSPKARFLSFSINYNLIAEDDQIKICKSSSKHSLCSIIQSNTKQGSKSFKLMSSKAYIEFKTSNRVSLDSRGWEISYSSGLCNGKNDIYKHHGVIGYTLSSGFSYLEGLSCHWILHGKLGTSVSINFTRINITKSLDFVAVYDGSKQQIASFSGVYSGSDLPQLNLSGVVIIEFSTQTDTGEGWSAKFFVSSPEVQEKKWLPVVVACVIGLVLSSVCLVFIAIALCRRKAKRGKDSDEGLMMMRIETLGEENRIGEGIHAIVYKAVSSDRGNLAIKCQRTIDADTTLEQEILLKCSSHPSIVSLLGKNSEDGLGRHNLVFEFMSRGDLALNLTERGQTLDWNQRISIALQICSAIQMLHMYLKPPVCHGNLSSENVLLDELCNAKLGGFGTAKYCISSRENPHQLSEMAHDIRCFGSLLVELLTGEPQGNMQDYGVNEFVGTQAILDKRLDIPTENCQCMALTKLSEIAKWCIESGQRVERYKISPKIGDILLGLMQVKHLFCSLSG